MDVRVLHSVLEKDDQMEVFAPTPPGMTKVVLATNIAESSVTLPRVRYVLDMATHKNIQVDKVINLTLTRKYGNVVLLKSWISMTSAKQRAGRTGRELPGNVFRFYSRHFHDAMEVGQIDTNLSRTNCPKCSGYHSHNHSFVSKY